MDYSVIDDKKLILYGAGKYGKMLALIFVIMDIPFECFCDADPQKQGTWYCGFPVKSIDEVKRTYKKGSYQILFSMYPQTALEAKRSLLEEGVFCEEDFYDEEKDSLMVMEYIRSPKPLCLSNDYKRYQRVPAPPSMERLSQNFLQLGANEEQLVKNAILTYHFHVNKYEELKSDRARTDFNEHLYLRLENDRMITIPWLDSIHTLENAAILEIGCGTGTSTVALCEQKAHVTAIDVDIPSIEAAKIRLRAYGLSAEVLCMNAEDIGTALKGRQFDLILYYASLEHMTYTEKIRSIRESFNLLSEDGCVVLIEIPNRLWWRDVHTSWEPFYNWLPDNVAMDYAKFVPRSVFNTENFCVDNPEDIQRFIRWGRGVSYHEFEIALNGRDKFQVISSLSEFYNLPNSIYRKLLPFLGAENIHPGFYEPHLDIALKPKKP